MPDPFGHFLARCPVADIESEPTAATGPAHIVVHGWMRSGVLDRPGFSSDACATLNIVFDAWRKQFFVPKV